MHFEENKKSILRLQKEKYAQTGGLNHAAAPCGAPLIRQSQRRYANTYLFYQKPFFSSTREMTESRVFIK